MDRIKPYAGKSADRLTALINQANTAPRVLGVDFLFGPPQDFTDVDGPRNTAVMMIRQPGTQYKADKQIKYIRLTLKVLDDLPHGWVRHVNLPEPPFTLHGVIDAINDALGLDLEPEEIQDVTYSERQASYLLPINNDVSLAWLNSNWQFQAHFPGEDIPLDEVIGMYPESGLVYPQPA